MTKTDLSDSECTHIRCISFGLGESWGFGKDYYFEQTMSLYELMDRARKWELDGLQITKVDLLTTAQDDPFGTENLKKVAQAAKEHGLFLNSIHPSRQAVTPV